MRSIKPILGLGVIAALVPAIIMTASASAASFLSSAKEKLLGENVGTLTFTTQSGTVECKKVNILAGETSGTEVTAQLALVDYEGCEVFGFISNEISPADYLFLANGAVDLLKLVRVFIPADQCELSVPAQTAREVDYATKGKNLLIESLFTGIEYTEGPHCSAPGKFTNGASKNHLEVMIPNGTVSFMK